MICFIIKICISESKRVATQTMNVCATSSSRDTRRQRRIFNCYEVFLDFENIILLYVEGDGGVYIRFGVTTDIFFAFPGC